MNYFTVTVNISSKHKHYFSQEQGALFYSWKQSALFYGYKIAILKLG